MKRIGIFLFLTLIFTSTVFAKTTDPRLVFGTGNDKFTYGISRNDDDRLSFSGHIKYGFDRFNFNLDMNAFTDRGSWPGGHYRNGRIDVISLDAVTRHSWNLKDSWKINFNPIVGVNLNGKIYFNAVQNIQHHMAGVADAEMKYDREDIGVSPIIGLVLGSEYDFGNFEVGINAEYRTSFVFSSKLSSYFELSMFDKLFALKLGYRFYQNYSNSKTMDAVVSVMKGPFLTFNLDASPFIMDWTYFPKSRFGYGTYYLNIMPIIKNNHSWKKTDVFFDYGFSKLFDMDLLNAGIRGVINEKFSALLEIGFVSGFPVSSTTTVRAQRNYGMFELGLVYTPIQWYVSPYIQAQMGLGMFQVVYLNSTNPELSGSNEFFPELDIFTSDVRLGINILPEGFVSFGNSSYQIQVFGGAHIIPSAERLTETIIQDKTHGKDWKANVFSPYYGFGVSIGIDVVE